MSWCRIIWWETQSKTQASYRDSSPAWSSLYSAKARRKPHKHLLAFYSHSERFYRIACCFWDRCILSAASLSYDVEKKKITSWRGFDELAWHLSCFLLERMKKTVLWSFWKQIVQLSFHIAVFVLDSQCCYHFICLIANWSFSFSFIHVCWKCLTFSTHTDSDDITVTHPLIYSPLW